MSNLHYVRRSENRNPHKDRSQSLLRYPDFLGTVLMLLICQLPAHSNAPNKCMTKAFSALSRHYHPKKILQESPRLYTSRYKTSLYHLVLLCYEGLKIFLFL